MTPGVLDEEVEMSELLCPNIKASVCSLFEQHLGWVAIAAVQSTGDLRDGGEERRKGDVLVITRFYIRNVVHKGFCNYE